MNYKYETMCLLAAATLGLLSGCTEPGQSRMLNTSHEATVEDLFDQVLADLKRAKILLPPQFVSIQANSVQLPASAEQIMNQGRSALPELEAYIRSKDAQRRIVAGCCISIIEATQLKRSDRFYLNESGVEFIQYDY